jgi:hypothetical protein
MMLAHTDPHTRAKQWHDTKHLPAAGSGSGSRAGAGAGAVGGSDLLTCLRGELLAATGVDILEDV